MKLDLSAEVRNAIEGMMAELQLLGMKPEGAANPLVIQGFIRLPRDQQRQVEE